MLIGFFGLKHRALLLFQQCSFIFYLQFKSSVGKLGSGHQRWHCVFLSFIYQYMTLPTSGLHLDFITSPISFFSGVLSAPPGHSTRNSFLVIFGTFAEILFKPLFLHFRMSWTLRFMFFHWKRDLNLQEQHYIHVFKIVVFAILLHILLAHLLQCVSAMLSEPVHFIFDFTL